MPCVELRTTRHQEPAGSLSSDLKFWRTGNATLAARTVLPFQVSEIKTGRLEGRDNPSLMEVQRYSMQFPELERNHSPLCSWETIHRNDV